MAKVHLWDYNHECKNSTPQITATTIVISAAVGGAPVPRCMNRCGDVKTIQTALNRFSPLEGGPVIPLKVDGICGPLTKAGITHFQQKWNLFPPGSNAPDGIIDVDGRTIKRLRAGSGLPLNLPAEFASRIPRVIEIVTATRAALALARDFLTRPQSNGGLPAFASIGKSEANKLDRHFHIRQKHRPVDRLDEVDKIFLGMQTAIGYIPQGLIVAVDEPPTTAVGGYMFTFAGGYNLRKPTDVWEGIAEGSIYLAPQARTLGKESFAYGMVHELAHYVGPKDPFGIDDVAYFARDPEKYAKLGPDQAFKNADSYAQFAFEVIGKPDFSFME